MSKYNRIMIFCLLAFISSCAHKNKLSALFSRVDGIDAGSEVRIKGKPVGEVTATNFFRDSVLVDMEFKEMKIPQGSKFFIIAPAVGQSYIEIEPSDDTIFLSGKDVVSGYFSKKGLLEDMIADSARREQIQRSLDKITEGITELIKAAKDSTLKNKK